MLATDQQIWIADKQFWMKATKIKIFIQKQKNFILYPTWKCIQKRVESFATFFSFSLCLSVLYPWGGKSHYIDDERRWEIRQGEVSQL